MRISAQQRQHNEARIRAAMDRLLRGDIPASGGCDAKTLAQQADVDRTAFYGTRPYAHLREEFENRLQALREAGEVSDLRAAQVARLKRSPVCERRSRPLATSGDCQPAPKRSAHATSAVIMIVHLVDGSPR
jgi:hypothetical protein